MFHHIPQALVILGYVLTLFLNGCLHGKPKDATTYDLPMATIRVIVGASILAWGGFFQ